MVTPKPHSSAELAAAWRKYLADESNRSKDRPGAVLPSHLIDLYEQFDACQKALSDSQDERLKMFRALKYYAESRNYRHPAGSLRDTPLGGAMEDNDSFDGEGAGARARAALSNPASRQVQEGVTLDTGREHPSPASNQERDPAKEPSS